MALFALLLILGGMYCIYLFRKELNSQPIGTRIAAGLTGSTDYSLRNIGLGMILVGIILGFIYFAQQEQIRYDNAVAKLAEHYEVANQSRQIDVYNIDCDSYTRDGVCKRWIGDYTITWSSGARRAEGTIEFTQSRADEPNETGSFSELGR